MKSDSLAFSAVLAALLLTPGASSSRAQTRPPGDPPAGAGYRTADCASPRSPGPAPAGVGAGPLPCARRLTPLRVLEWSRAPVSLASARGREPDAGWKEHVIHGHTRYRVVEMGRKACLAADSRADGSILYREIAPIPTDALHLTWSWQVNTFPRGADLRRKEADDRAAAVVVLYRKSILPWKLRAIMYVWSRDVPAETIMKSTFSGEIRILVVRSGEAAGWRVEDRDLAADYRRVFGGEADPVKAVGVYTDSDNTRSEASAVYGPLTFARPAGAASVASVGR